MLWGRVRFTCTTPDAQTQHANPVTPGRRLLMTTLLQELTMLTRLGGGAFQVSKRAATEMVRKHLKKHPPSLYMVGDKVLIRKTKGTKVQVTKIVKGIVRKTNHEKHRYLVESASGLHWYPVRTLAATSRAKDLERQQYQRWNRIRLFCQCSVPECREFADFQCRNTMSKKCCRSQNRKCWLSSHRRRRISITDFVLPQNKTTTFLDLGNKLSQFSAVSE